MYAKTGVVRFCAERKRWEKKVTSVNMGVGRVRDRNSGKEGP